MAKAPDAKDLKGRIIKVQKALDEQSKEIEQIKKESGENKELAKAAEETKGRISSARKQADAMMNFIKN